MIFTKFGVLFLMAPHVFSIPQESVKCISNISKTYFPEGKPLLLSISPKETDVGYLLQELHNLLKWPVQIYSPNPESMDDEFDNTDKHGSYVVIINSLEDEMIEILEDQVAEIDGSENWNPRAKFLVVIRARNIKERKHIAQKVAEHFWKNYKIVDVVILIPEIDNGRVKERVNEKMRTDSRYLYRYIGKDNEIKQYGKNDYDKQFDMKDFGKIITFEMYTWIPYQSSNICNEVNVFLIDKWLIDKESFENGLNLYPKKIPNHFHGCPIIVSPMEAPPIYVMAVNYTDDDGKTIYDYKGYELAHMKTILGLLNFSIVYKHIPMLDSYNTRVESLFDLRSGIVDIVMGCIPLHPIVGSMNDPTHVVYGDDIYWLVPCGKPNPRMRQVTRIFSGSLWSALILVIIVSAIVMWQVTKYSVGASLGYKSISISLLNLWALTLGVGVSEIPKTPRQRIVFLFLMWYSLSISLLFQTYFTSILVDPGIDEQIHSRQELYSSDLMYVYNEGLDTYISNAYPEYHEEITLPRRKCKYDTCVVEYYRRDDITTISSTLFTECFLLLALPNHNDAPHFCTVEEVITTILFPMYLSKGSPIVQPINRMIRLMQESGLRNKVDREAKAAFRYENLDIDFEFDDTLLDRRASVDYFVFSMSHLKMAFYMLGLGCSFGSVVLVLEILHFKMSRISKWQRKKH